MRTKTLLLTAALSAAGLTTSMAQTVYSVNAVGFVNVTVAAGSFALLSNPLNQATNDLASVLPDAPANTTSIYDLDAATSTYSIYTKRATAWAGTGADTARLNPGKGFFLRNTATTPITLTVIGEVPQGTLTTSIRAGFNLLGSQVPQAGAIETLLGLPAANGDVVFVLNAAGAYDSATRRATSWPSGEPTLGVAQGFFLNAAAAKTWTRTFSVNN